VARNGTDATIRFRRPVSRPADGILVPARSRHRIERHSLRVELGRKVAEQGRRRGWSQPELALRLGKPASWVSRLERGIADRGSLPVLHILPDHAAGRLSKDSRLARESSALDAQGEELRSHDGTSSFRAGRPRNDPRPYRSKHAKSWFAALVTQTSH
jgi:transcriptional regulator with XRE-family HTH domain